MIRNNECRKVGYEQEYPGTTCWAIYQYLCCECGQWGDCSGTERVNDDGTVSPICPDCEANLPLIDL